VSAVRPAGKLHQGCTTVQKSVAKQKPQAVSETGSRRGALALGHQQRSEFVGFRSGVAERPPRLLSGVMSKLTT
jgi:hypothetical protein